MTRVRTTINPTEEIEVSDAQLDDLRAQGLLLEGTRATTAEGLTEAAIRQVREGSYSPETRAGIEAGEARAEARRVRPRRPRRSRADDAVVAPAPAPAPTPEPAPREEPTAAPDGGDTADDTATETSGDDTPAETTDANQES